MVGDGDPTRWVDVERNRDMGREATQCTSGGEVSMHTYAELTYSGSDVRFGYRRRAIGYLRWAEERAFASVRDETLKCLPK